MSSTSERPAVLALADGSVFVGRSVGAAPPASSPALGEVVFNTAMTGYQEILTDPSYTGQLVAMTATQMGNYGVTDEDAESHKPFAAGFIMRELTPRTSNWRATQDLASYLADHAIPAISEVDTRALTRRLRTTGALMGALAAGDDAVSKQAALVAAARGAPTMDGLDLVPRVTCRKAWRWGDAAGAAISRAPERGPNARPRVVVYDFGVKLNIVRLLAEHGCEVVIVPATTAASEVRALSPAGVVLSNGPGDPAAVTYAIESARALVGQLPLFGICLGHQILGLALGGKTYKLKFGHHGANHPVRDVATGRVEITSQNHGFCVDPESLRGKGAVVTHVNLNDGTTEGLALPSADVWAVQYHPEASPGPHDSRYLFPRFMERVRACTSKSSTA